MLKTIQIIALVQGFFLLLILFRKKNNYKKVTFWFFIGSVLSILLFILGDDDNNLFKENADWFLLDSSLFITFLFLFFRYYKSKKIAFEKRDLLFFIPNIIYFIIEGIEIIITKENAFIESVEMLIEAAFLSYLFYILIDFFKQKQKFWLCLQVRTNLYFSTN